MPYKFCALPSYPAECDVWDILKAERRPIVVYGMGNGADKLLRRFASLGIEVADFFASDGFVRGHSFHGKRVKSFSEIKAEYPDFVIVLSFATNRGEVIEMLREIDAEYELFVPDMPVVGDEYFDREYFNNHYAEIEKAYSLLEDEESRSLYAAVINYRLSGKLSYIIDEYSEKSELYSLIKSDKEIRTVVDAGAYNGDTVRDVLSEIPQIERIYAFEPDRRNYKKLEKYREEDARVIAINAAVYSETATGYINASGNRNTSIESSSYEHKSAEVAFVRIDEAVPSCDYIKYDVEGAELPALIGSESLINKSRPVLLVSLYHKSGDIFSLPLYLDAAHPGYRYYLRRLRSIPAWELDLVMLPVDKKFGM